MKKLSILCPNGHLAYAPIEVGSYELGLAENPDAVCADSGSCDIGPAPLGSDESASLEKWQRHDIALMLSGSRKINAPMIIGSASDTGTNRGVDNYVRYIKDAAAEQGQPGFKLASIRSNIDHDFLLRQLNNGAAITGLGNMPDLTVEDLERTDNFVAVMGVEPIMAALCSDADAIITSRTSDCCIFAAFGLFKGFAPEFSYYLGKVLECSSFCAEPYMGKESVIGTIDPPSIYVKAMHPRQRCTPASVAGHAMYERVNPFTESFAGGSIDMSECSYSQFDEKTTRITGMKYCPSERYCVKLEGAGKVGERAYSIIGIRDPETIARIDDAIKWARDKTASLYGKPDDKYQLFYHVYGKNAVMGEFETVNVPRSHELGVVVEAVADTRDEAIAIATMGARGVFYARLNNKGSAGAVAFLTETAIYAGPVYEWTMNHIMEIDSPTAYFPVTCEEVGR